MPVPSFQDANIINRVASSPDPLDLTPSAEGRENDIERWTTAFSGNPGNQIKTLQEQGIPVIGSCVDERTSETLPVWKIPNLPMLLVGGSDPRFFISAHSTRQQDDACVQWICATSLGHMSNGDLPYVPHGQVFSLPLHKGRPEKKHEADPVYADGVIPSIEEAAEKYGFVNHAMRRIMDPCPRYTSYDTTVRPPQPWTEDMLLEGATHPREQSRILLASWNTQAPVGIEASEVVWHGMHTTPNGHVVGHAEIVSDVERSVHAMITKTDNGFQWIVPYGGNTVNRMTNKAYGNHLGVTWYSDREAVKALHPEWTFLSDEPAPVNVPIMLANVDRQIRHGYRGPDVLDPQSKTHQIPSAEPVEGFDDALSQTSKEQFLSSLISLIPRQGIALTTEATTMIHDVVHHFLAAEQLTHPIVDPAMSALIHEREEVWKTARPDQRINALGVFRATVHSPHDDIKASMYRLLGPAAETYLASETDPVHENPVPSMLTASGRLDGDDDSRRVLPMPVSPDLKPDIDGYQVTAWDDLSSFGIQDAVAATSAGCRSVCQSIVPNADPVRWVQQGSLGCVMNKGSSQEMKISVWMHPQTEIIVMCGISGDAVVKAGHGVPTSV